MNLMREVELQEKEAEKAKEDASIGGFDTLDKVEELKKMLEHAKEANDMVTFCYLYFTDTCVNCA